MFNGCKKLTYVNLSNLGTSNLGTINNMFEGCESLKIIDFPNLDLTNVNKESLKDVFLKCPNLEYINIYNFKSNNFVDIFFKSIQRKLIICIHDTELIKEIADINGYTLKSYKGNLPGNEFKLNEENKCFTEYCMSTTYKYKFKHHCFEECPANSKKREENIKELNLSVENHFCKPICNEIFPFEIINEQECVMNCDITRIINELCILNYDKKGKSIIYDTLLKNIEDYFISNEYDTSEIENGNNDVINYKEMMVTLTSINNQKNDENKGNISTINIGECERLLKAAYNISNEETLFMKKIDVKEEGMMIPKIEFNAYYKLNGRNLVRLNLSYCYDVKIDISIPLEINEPLDKYKSRSGYYNDICYTTTSEDGTDILLIDR